MGSIDRNSRSNAANALVQQAQLGGPSAFVSHSWHDDPVQKYESLRNWCDEFASVHGVEPTLWIDYHCAEQTSLHDRLRALPVYVAGCKKLLVLFGETFLERLWCIVEIFIFLQMGGDSMDIDIRMVGNLTMQHVDQLIEQFTMKNVKTNL